MSHRRAKQQAVKSVVKSNAIKIVTQVGAVGVLVHVLPHSAPVVEGLVAIYTEKGLAFLLNHL